MPTLAVVANCLNMIADERARIGRPTGMDEEHLLVVQSEPFAPEFENETYVRASYDEDLRVLRALPGVRAATASHQIPLSGSGSNNSRRPTGTWRSSRSAPRTSSWARMSSRRSGWS